jgi:hypothetical protein
VSSEYSEATVTIYLFKGTHYAIWNYDRYVGSMMDMHSNHLEMIIQPLPCTKGAEYGDVCAEIDEKVIIINKRKNFLFFEVEKKLTMKNMIIDSIDSIIRGLYNIILSRIDSPLILNELEHIDDEYCLEKTEQCCMMDSEQQIVKYDSTSDYECEIHFPT